MERVELEDTIAQLNVAAAQLYRVEYEQMKVCANATTLDHLGANEAKLDMWYGDPTSS